jgi:hypothetical protein
MKQLFILLIALACSFVQFSSCDKAKASTEGNNIDKPTEPDRVLRHVVLFQFNDSTTTEDIDKIESSFAALKSKIPEVHDLEWGLNNSPEGLDKGFTHCFFLTFKSEADRDVYLPHPEHQAFVDLVGPHVKDVLVVDYWSD